MTQDIDPARIQASIRADRDLLRAGATPEQVALVDEIARRLRSDAFRAAEIMEAAEAEARAGPFDDLRLALAGAGVASAGALGRLLGRLEGSVVRRAGAEDGAGLWSLDWPRRTRPPKDQTGEEAPLLPPAHSDAPPTQPKEGADE